MQKRTVFFFIVLTAIVSAVIHMACSPALDKQLVKSAIDVGLATCIADNADIQEEAALKEICKWGDELAPIVKDLLGARSKGLAKAAAKSAPKPCLPIPPSTPAPPAPTPSPAKDGGAK